VLVLPNSSDLKRYSTAELSEALKEKTERFHDLYRLSDHNELTDTEKRGGQWMHSSELIHKITRLNPMVWVEHQINFPEDWGFYTCINNKRIFVCQFPKGWMREFSTIVTDHRNLADGKQHGWRQVLLLLMTKGILTWEQVHKAFGDSESQNSDRWQRYTQMFKQGCYSGNVLRNVANEF